MSPLAPATPPNRLGAPHVWGGVLFCIGPGTNNCVADTAGGPNKGVPLAKHSTRCRRPPKREKTEQKEPGRDSVVAVRHTTRPAVVAKLNTRCEAVRTQANLD